MAKVYFAREVELADRYGVSTYCVMVPHTQDRVYFIHYLNVIVVHDYQTHEIIGSIELYDGVLDIFSRKGGPDYLGSVSSLREARHCFY